MFVLGYLSLNWINPHNIVHLLYTKIQTFQVTRLSYNILNVITLRRTGEISTKKTFLQLNIIIHFKRRRCYIKISLVLL